MTRETVGSGLVGCGFMGRAHTRALGYRAAVVCDAILLAAEQGRRVDVTPAEPVSIGERSM